MRCAAVLGLAATLLCNAAWATPERAPERTPEPAPCPAGLPAATRCLTGRDDAGAFYWIAVPPAWNGVLVLHAHGGPELGEPRAERSAQDLKRWAVMLKAGYAVGPANRLQAA